jgi:hypothetical protein
MGGEIMCKSDHEREIIERDAKSHALVEENAIRKDEQKRLAKKSEMDEREFVIRQHIRFWLGKYLIDGTVLEVAESEIFTLTRADCARQLREGHTPISGQTPDRITGEMESWTLCEKCSPVDLPWDGVEFPCGYLKLADKWEGK